MEYDPEAYAHIWEGEFDTRHSGAVYAKWVQKLYDGTPPRISDDVKWDPLFPVYTVWDLGYDDSTSIWFYQLGFGEIFIIDAYENNGEGIGHYCEYVKSKEYQYADHYVPHDAANKLMAAGGRSIIEQAWRDYGVRMVVVPATSQMNSIEALRMTLPRCWFNKENCSEGLDALMQYSLQYDDKMETFKSIPIHNWASHYCDALELMARMWQTKTMTTKEIDKKERGAKFERLRVKMGLTNLDPYRIKPRRKPR